MISDSTEQSGKGAEEEDAKFVEHVRNKESHMDKIISNRDSGKSYVPVVYHVIFTTS